MLSRLLGNSEPPQVRRRIVDIKVNHEGVCGLTEDRNKVLHVAYTASLNSGIHWDIRIT